MASKRGRGVVCLADLDAFQPNQDEITRHRGDNLTPAVLRLVRKVLLSRPDQKVRLLGRKNNSLPWYVRYDGDRGKKGEAGTELESFLQSVLRFLAQDLGRSPKELQSLITVSTAHKAKGLEATMVIVLDAVERSYPLIHPNWVFTRILGDSLEKIIAEERRLFYVALTRAEESLTILTSGRNPSPFIDEIQEHMTVRNLDWSSLDSLSD